MTCGYCDGGRYRSEGSGRRKPSGESPGTTNNLPERVLQSSVLHRFAGEAAAFQRCTGST